MDARLLGSFGEARAAEYLRRKGYSILAMNYRTRLGELDVIAADRHYLVFAEVKLRKNNAYGEAREYVTARKQQRLVLAARQWLQQNPDKRQPRFDVIEVYAPRGPDGPVELKHWENAFELS